MEIVEDKERGSVILRPIGRLDGNHSPDLEQAVHGIFERGDKNLLVDLTDVPYISSRGLRVFLLGVKEAASVGGRMAVCSLQDFVKDAFGITGFTKLMGIHDSRTEALDSLHAASKAENG